MRLYAKRVKYGKAPNPGLSVSKRYPMEIQRHLQNYFMSSPTKIWKDYNGI